MTIRRSEGWLGCDAECDPNTTDRGGHRHHARTRDRSGGRGVGSDRAVAAATAGASAGLSPATGAGPVVLLGDPDPADDGVVVGRHRSDPRASGVGHDAAGPPRRVDRGRRVRPAAKPKRSPRSTGSSGSTCPRSPSTAACTRRPTAAKEPARTPLIVGSWAGSGPSPSTVTASRSAGRSTAPTATTSACSIPTLDAVAAAGLLVDIDTLHLDRGYDYRRRARASRRLRTRRPRHPTARHQGAGKKQPVRLGLRWIVEATNSWWSNYGQLRRNTDRRNRHRHAALCLATTILIVGKLIAWRDRWSPTVSAYPLKS